MAKAYTGDVDSILGGKYPAKNHARRVAEYIKSKKPGEFVICK